MVLWFTLLVFTGIKQVSSAPIDKQYVSWQDEPNSRGTWSILSSCLVTLILCVYTAVHTNVPHPYDSLLRKRLRMTQWVLTGVFAPEMVVWVAWDEWKNAKDLSKELEVLRIEQPAKEETVPFNPIIHRKYRSIHDLLDTWTLQHSFFVGMGGYQFDPSKVAQNWKYPGRTRCMMHRNTFMAFLKDGHVDRLPVLTGKDLADRSKADYLAKLLSCIQGLWLAIQLLGRVVSHLTITELEVNTFAHVLCAIAMYAFWMSKPLNIEQPAWLDAEGLDDWILFQSGLRSRTRAGLYLSRKGFTTSSSLEGLRPHVHHPSDYVDGFTCDKCDTQKLRLDNREIVGLMIRGSDIELDADQVIEILAQTMNGQFIDFVIHGSFPKRRYWTGKTKWHDKYTRNVILVESQEELETFLQIWNLPSLGELVARLPTDDYSLHYEPHMTSATQKSSVSSVFVMLTVSCCYGALHASLWWHHFPTILEQWLWRIASLAVAANSAFIIIAIFIILIEDGETPEALVKLCGGHDPGKFIRVPLKWGQTLSDFIVVPVKAVLLAFVFAAQLVFVFSRVYLVIEAFISLRSQPVSAYETPQWSQWVPHL